MISSRPTSATIDRLGWLPRALVLSAGLYALVSGGQLWAQTSPIYSEDILVNEETDGYHVNPRIIAVPVDPPVGPSGGSREITLYPRFSIVFSETNSNWDPARSEAWGREVDYSGWGIGPPQRYVSSTQQENQVSDVGFRRPGGIDLAAIYAIELQVNGGDVALFDSATQLESQFPVTPGIKWNPRVVTYDDGNGMGMVFSTNHDPSGVDIDDSIGFQLWDTSSTPVLVGGYRRVNGVTEGNTPNSDLDVLRHAFEGGFPGVFLVVWESFGSAGDDDSLSSIQLRFVGIDGVPVDSQIQVNTYINGYQSRPEVAALEDGNFVVVWSSDGSWGNDDSLTSIQARLYSNDGTPLGPEFQVNNEIQGFQYFPTVAAQNDGGFIVAWNDAPLSTVNIAARRYLAGGVPAGDQFQVNTLNGTSFDDAPSIAALGSEFAVIWVRGGDVYINGTFGWVFADGFESGDGGAWSSSNP